MTCTHQNVDDAAEQAGLAPFPLNHVINVRFGRLVLFRLLEPNFDVARDNHRHSATRLAGSGENGVVRCGLALSCGSGDDESLSLKALKAGQA